MKFYILFAGVLLAIAYFGYAVGLNQKEIQISAPEPVVCILQHYPEVETVTYQLEKYGEHWDFSWFMVSSDSTQSQGQPGDIIELDVVEVRLISIRHYPDTTITILGK